MSTQTKFFIVLAIGAAFVLGGTAALFAVERPGFVPESSPEEPAMFEPQAAIGPIPASIDTEAQSLDKKAEAPIMAGTAKQDATQVKVQPAPAPARTRIVTAARPVNRTAIRASAPLVRAGTLLDARLMTSISSTSSYVGQPVWAETMEDFYADGRLVVPAHTWIEGRITSVKSFDFVSPARLEVEFFRIGDKASRLSLLSPSMDRWAKQAYDLAVALPATRTGELALDAGYLVLLKVDATTRM